MGADLCAACLRDGSKGEQRLDVFEREAELLCPLNEAHAPHGIFRVQPVIRSAPRRSLDKPPTLMVPKRLDMYPGLLSHLSNRQSVRSGLLYMVRNINPGARYGVKSDVGKCPGLFPLSFDHPETDLSAQRTCGAQHSTA
jgi:hypothetical protein